MLQMENCLHSPALRRDRLMALFLRHRQLTLANEPLQLSASLLCSSVIKLAGTGRRCIQGEQWASLVVLLAPHLLWIPAYPSPLSAAGTKGQQCPAGAIQTSGALSLCSHLLGLQRWHKAVTKGQAMTRSSGTG